MKQYGDYLQVKKEEVEKAKAALIESAKQMIETAAQDDDFWIIKDKDDEFVYVGIVLRVGQPIPQEVMDRMRRENFKKALEEARDKWRAGEFI